MKPPSNKSIRRQLLCWLLLPLCSLWLITTSTAYFFAETVANRTFDRELLNSADSVYGRIRVRGGLAFVDITPESRAILRHNNRVSFYYQVMLPDGRRLSGDDVMPAPDLKAEVGKKLFSYGRIGGQDVRVLQMSFPDLRIRSGSFLIQVAETLETRKTFANELQLAMMIPQAMLIVLGAVTISSGVGRGLRPLGTLQDALGRRTPADLSPVDEADVPVEVQSLVAAINDLLGRLRLEIESQKRFVANAAHQLRTPLAGLKTYIGFGRKRPADKETKLVFDQLEKGIDRMTHLVNRLLSLARAEPAVTEVEKTVRLDLNSVASEAASDLIAEAIGRGVDLSFEASADPAYIMGDGAALKELATNLAENAVRYTQPGGQVRMRVLAGSPVELVVEDNGPGIPEQERERVFERFYRILGSNVTGSGLGLSIVSEIAQMHEAQVTLSDGPQGQGSTFRVAFRPAADETVHS